MGVFQLACSLALLPVVARSQELQNCNADNTLLTVTSTEDAAALATSLDCANGNFTVQWDGEVLVEETIRVNNATSLSITGAGPGATAHGDDTMQLFVVKGGSRLHLSDMTLAHGNASADGGAVHVESSILSLSGSMSFVYNSALHGGGAISAFDSTVSWDGDGTVFSNNSAGTNGGGMHLEDSTVSWSGDGTGFFNNSADYGGGAIYSYNTTVSWDGDGAEFSNNYAQSFGGAIRSSFSTVFWNGDNTVYFDNYAVDGGGAIFSFLSNVSWNGEGAEFSNNHANYGGAISLSDSTFSWGGDGTAFSNNSADTSGGALYSETSNVSWDGDSTLFISNFADYDIGGAILSSYSNLIWHGDGTEFSSNYAEFSGGAILLINTAAFWRGDGTLFSSNHAGVDGGAITLWDSTLSWFGDDSKFSHNGAGSGFGGAIYAELRSAVSWAGPTRFRGNVAKDGGGAIALVNFGYEETRFSDATFVENSSGNGGAFYVHNSAEGFNFTDLTFQANSASNAGGAFAMYAGTDHAPTTFSRCTFTDNSATGAGGAVETLSGQQEFFLCDFDGNSADAGGAMSLGGETVIQECSFVSNYASARGLAVAVVGSANFSDSSFDGNDLFCALGSYREEIEEEETTKRFEAVCLDCAPWDECSGCSITRGNVTPTCVATLDHTTAEEAGVTLETLNITRGFWRATNKSGNILACFNADACSGGQTGAEGYCAPGYKGPYCAVCETDYAPSLSHTCTRCSSSRRQGLMAATVLAAVMAVCAIVTIFKYFVSTEFAERNIGWFHRRVLRAVPVQALKIVVVVWQILTQFADAASVTYPGVYHDFLDVIDVVNLNFGSMVAAGCLWPGMDFHDRLLVGTIGPLVVVVFLGMTFWIAMRRNGAASHTAVGEKIRQKHQTALLLLTFLVYSSVSAMVFQTFACETLDDGVEYLRADYRIYCTDTKHKVMEAYAGLMVLVYPVGIPLLYAVLLYQHRDVLSDAHADKTAAQPISSLWESYRPERFYYEVVECGRRIMLTGVVVFIYPNDAAQIAITMLISFFFFAVFDFLSPYMCESDMWLSRVGHVLVFLSMFDMLLLKVDVSSERDQSQAVFAAVLVTGHVLMVLAIVLEVIGICYASRKQRVAEEAVPSERIPESRPGARSQGAPVSARAPFSLRSFLRQAWV